MFTKYISTSLLGRFLYHNGKYHQYYLLYSLESGLSKYWRIKLPIYDRFCCDNWIKYSYVARILCAIIIGNTVSIKDGDPEPIFLKLLLWNLPLSQLNHLALSILTSRKAYFFQRSQFQFGFFKSIFPMCSISWYSSPLPIHKCIPKYFGLLLICR